MLAGDLGLAPRCLVVDLDNTLWGGIVGDDGPDGDRRRRRPRRRGLRRLPGLRRALSAAAACSSPSPRRTISTPRASRSSATRACALTLDDFAAFVADWRPKSEQIAEIAADARARASTRSCSPTTTRRSAPQVAAALPEVTTICARRAAVRARADARRERAPRDVVASPARTVASAALLRRSRQAEPSCERDAPSLDDFWRSLEMRARVRDVDAASLERAAQLTQKTNQFNLTLDRRTPRAGRAPRRRRRRRSA